MSLGARMWFGLLKAVPLLAVKPSTKRQGCSTEDGAHTICHSRG